MALFKYRAVDEQGNSLEGSMEEASARRALLALQGRGLQVNSVERVGPEPKRSFASGALSWKEIEQFNAQLAVVTRSGLPLAPAIAAMSRDIRSPRLRALLAGLQADLEGGKPLEEALARHPESFSPTYMALIRAGERSGNLPAVFLHLSDYSRSMLELKSQLQEILVYPLILIAAACILVSFLLVKVVPVFVQIYADFGGSLPAPTMLLVHLSDALFRYFPTILTVLAVVTVLVVISPFTLGRSVKGRYVLDLLRSWIPIVGRVYTRTSLARFCRTLRLMLESNVPLLESLELAAAAAGNAVLGRAITVASRGVSGGSALADSLDRTGYFDGGFCWLLRNAEQRGELQQALCVLEDEYERTLAHMRTRILTLLGPCVVVAIGLFVAFFVISIYLPIFSLGDVVSGC